MQLKIEKTSSTMRIRLQVKKAAAKSDRQISNLNKQEIKMHTDKTTNAYPQQRLLKSTILHILPGVLVTLGFIILKPVLGSSGYPPLTGFLAGYPVDRLTCDVGYHVVFRLETKRALEPRWNCALSGEAPVEKICLGFHGCICRSLFADHVGSPLTAFLTERVFSWNARMGCFWMSNPNIKLMPKTCWLPSLHFNWS